jgi:hypothetical protein
MIAFFKMNIRNNLCKSSEYDYNEIAQIFNLVFRWVLSIRIVW